ncbi:unnamed protein product [Orchesella dallaii]|uniref:C2H2-type domain-containing protein n=1 Tax=Orchesella dallaii TaxID=48710 RepID=A0ABP1QNK9_9HEXA
MRVLRSTKQVPYQVSNDLFLDSSDEEDLIVVDVRGASSAHQNHPSPICITIDDDDDDVNMSENSCEHSCSFEASSSSMANSSYAIQTKDEPSNHHSSEEERSTKEVACTQVVELECQVQKKKVQMDNVKVEYIELNEVTDQLLNEIPKVGQINQDMKNALNKAKKEIDDLKIKLAASDELKKQQRKTLEKEKQVEDIKLLKIQLNTRPLETRQKMVKKTIAFEHIEIKTKDASDVRKDFRNQSVTLSETREESAKLKKLVESLQSKILMLNTKNEQHKKEKNSLRLKANLLKGLNDKFVENSKTFIRLHNRLLTNSNMNDDEEVVVEDEEILNVIDNAHVIVDVNPSVQESVPAAADDRDDDDDVIFIEEKSSERMVTRSKAPSRQNPMQTPVRKVTKPRFGKIKRGPRYHSVDLDSEASTGKRCICGKGFNRVKSLSDHIRLYGLEENAARCGKCPKSYINLARLRNHEAHAHKMH